MVAAHASPIVKPLMVTVNAEEAPIVAPDVVRTVDLSLVAPKTMLKPATLLVPASTKGVTKGWKKLMG